MWNGGNMRLLIPPKSDKVTDNFIECHGILRNLERTLVKGNEKWELKVTTNLSNVKNFYAALSDEEMETLFQWYQDEKKRKAERIAFETTSK